MVMNEQTIAERIVVSRDINHGQPRIAGTRIPIHLILELLASGKSIDDIISADYYPELTRQDVLACVAYAGHLVRNETIIPT